MLLLLSPIFFCVKSQYCYKIGGEASSKQNCQGEYSPDPSILAIVPRLEGVADAEVKGHIRPLEVVYPAFALGAAGVVELYAEVEAYDDKRDVDT